MAKEEYTKPGVYSYQMYEVEPEVGETGRMDGMIYDLTWHTFSVYVSDADMDGQLEIVRVHSEHADKDFELVEGVYTINAGFENTQTVTVPALATVEIQKVLENLSGSPLATLAGYNFGLYTDSECLTTAITGNGIKTINLNPTDAVGEGWIDIQFDAEGTYTFYIKELAGSQSGMTYSEQVIKIVVEVKNSDAAGVLVATTSYYAADGSEYDLGDDGEVEFENTYVPKSAVLAINFVNKELSGREMNANDNFTFEVQDLNGNTVLSGSNNGAKKVTFTGTLEFAKVGQYFYNIVETTADGKGITADKTTYRMVVTVSDVEGRLTASYVLLNVVGDEITFVNNYTVQFVEHSIDGTKALRGRTLINDEFTFVLTELTVDGTEIQNPRSWNAKNFANGSFAFPAIKYDQAGSYTYRVEEIIPEGGKAYGITYDSTKYVATVVVHDNGEGNLVIASESVAMLNGTSASALSFLNEYQADPTWAQFTGDKTLTGKVNSALEGGEFEFILYNSDANWTQGSEREKVENGAGGIITFTKIDFDTDKDQHFIIVEKNGGRTIQGITYDDTVYRVWVEVTDDLKGHLHATVHIYDGEGIPQDKISFTNVYEVTGGANVILSGEKIIDGREWKNSDSFILELYEADENYNAAETPKMFVDVDFVTHKYTITLDYTADDVGKTYYYVLAEKNGGMTIDGLAYSNVEYQIKVEVYDNDTGGVGTKATVVDATTSTLNFINEYSIVSGTSVQFEATKELDGKELGNNKFSFDLIESNANWESVKVLQAKENIGESIGFDKIDYMTAGDYYYIISEQKAGQTVNGITYDDTVYRIYVKVTDNLDGTLSKNVTITKLDRQTEGVVEEIEFTNVFVPGPADITVDIDIIKMVVNMGTDKIGPEDFEFLLKNLADSAPGITAKSDKDGKAKFTLTFTEDDIGKTYSYKLTEVDGGRANVTYSSAEYAITISITLDEETNTLIATLTQNEAAVTEPIAEFENIYNANIPESPHTGDNSNLAMWVALMFISGGALTLCVYDKKKRRQAGCMRTAL